MNPYEPTLRAGRPQYLPERRLIVLALFTSGVAVLSLGVGVLIASESFGVSQRQGMGTEIAKGYLVAFGFISLGALWAATSKLYWSRQNRRGFAVGIAAITSTGLFILSLMLGVIP